MPGLSALLSQHSQVLQVSLCEVSPDTAMMTPSIPSCRYCSQRCLTNDWKYHSHSCRKPQKDGAAILGSRRLKGSKKEEHRRACDILLAKFDPVLASVLFDGFLRNYLEYEDKERCLQYQPDKVRLNRVPQTLRECDRCDDKYCVKHCEVSCILM